MRKRQDFFSNAFFKKKKKKLRKGKGQEKKKEIAAFSGKKKSLYWDTFYTKSIVAIKTLPMKRIVQDQAEHWET